MLSRFLKSTLLLLLFVGFGAHSTTVDLHHVNYAKQQKHSTTTSTVSTKSNNTSVIDLLLGHSSPAHITNQNYKPTHFTKLALLFTQHVLASLSSAKYKIGRSASSFSLFRKQILFPFHGFW